MEEMTVKDVLKRVIANLGRIRIPATLANDVARPIWEALQDLNDCVNALDEPEKAEEVKEDNV